MLDASLDRAFANWAARQNPPARVRADLLRTIKLEVAAGDKQPVRLPSQAEWSTLYAGPVVSINLCFGLFFSLHARIRW